MNFKKYIGVKIIHATPCTADQAENVLHKIVSKENADTEGNGYLVRYPDGYTSWSPKVQFEEAYSLIDGLDFGLALAATRKGLGIRLPQWSTDVSIRMQFPDIHSKMTAPYLYAQSRFGRVPWIPTQIELLSDKWEVTE